MAEAEVVFPCPVGPANNNNPAERPKELKCLTRQVLEYQSVDWDLEYLMWQQDCIHDEYEEKEKQISVNIC